MGVASTAYGTQKLFTWFGSAGLEGTTAWITAMGLDWAWLLAILIGGTEFIGGLMLISGFLIRPAAFVLAIAMLVAIIQIGNGMYVALLVMLISLFIRGAGSLSIDQWLSKKYVPKI